MRIVARAPLWTLIAGILVVGLFALSTYGKTRNWLAPVTLGTELLQSARGDHFLKADLAVNGWSPSAWQELGQRLKETVGLRIGRIPDHRKKLCQIWHIEAQGVSRYELGEQCLYRLVAGSDALWLLPPEAPPQVWSPEGFRPALDGERPPAADALDQWTREAIQVYGDPVEVRLAGLPFELVLSREQVQGWFVTMDVGFSILLRTETGTVPLMEVDEVWFRVSEDEFARTFDAQPDGRRQEDPLFAIRAARGERR